MGCVSGQLVIPNSVVGSVANTVVGSLVNTVVGSLANTVVASSSNHRARSPSIINWGGWHSSS